MSGKPGETTAPPHLVQREFLPAGVVAGLFDLVARNERAFVPSRVGSTGEGGIDRDTRISAVLPDIEPFDTILGRHIAPLAAGVARHLGIAPFKLTRVQIELAAHGDGAFYVRHTDVQQPDPVTKTVRLLSGVYYFHHAPKGFSGGALRLYGPAQATHVDIEPVHNSCVFFPPQLLHEVLPIACPSRRFADSRFAVNFWFVGHPL